jgi:hypothetical protein
MSKFGSVEVEIWSCEVEQANEFFVVRKTSCQKLNGLLHHGVGAKISIFMMFHQPKAMDFAKYSNASKIDALGDL